MLSKLQIHIKPWYLLFLFVLLAILSAPITVTFEGRLVYKNRPSTSITNSPDGLNGAPAATSTLEGKLVHKPKPPVINYPHSPDDTPTATGTPGCEPAWHIVNSPSV